MDEDDVWIVCPRCDGEIELIKLFDDREEWFVRCTVCSWGED